MNICYPYRMTRIDDYYRISDEKITRSSKLADTKRVYAEKLLKTVAVIEACVQAVEASGRILFPGFDANDQAVSVLRRWVEDDLRTNELMVPHERQLRIQASDIAYTLRWTLFRPAQQGELSSNGKQAVIVRILEDDVVFSASHAVLILLNQMEDIFKIEDFSSRIRHRLIIQFRKSFEMMRIAVRQSVKSFDALYGSATQTPGESIVINMLNDTE